MDCDQNLSVNGSDDGSLLIATSAWNLVMDVDDDHCHAIIACGTINFLAIFLACRREVMKK